MLASKIYAVALIVCGLFSLCAEAEQFSSQVAAVLDGDTVILADQQRVRLAGIDAPEKQQPFGRQSKDALARLVLNKSVHVNSYGLDRYGRLLAFLEVDGVDVNAALVRSGMAWSYAYQQGVNQSFAALQQAAQQQHIGIWSKKNRIQPYQWRKQTDDYAYMQGSCGRKHSCSQMKSCQEAKFYLFQCGVEQLDANHDGTPCERLCLSMKDLR